MVPLSNNYNYEFIKRPYHQWVIELEDSLKGNCHYCAAEGLDLCVNLQLKCGVIRSESIDSVRDNIPITEVRQVWHEFLAKYKSIKKYIFLKNHNCKLETKIQLTILPHFCDSLNHFSSKNTYIYIYKHTLYMIYLWNINSLLIHVRSQIAITSLYIYIAHLKIIVTNHIYNESIVNIILKRGFYSRINSLTRRPRQPDPSVSINRFGRVGQTHWASNPPKNGSSQLKISHDLIMCYFHDWLDVFASLILGPSFLINGEN